MLSRAASWRGSTPPNGVSILVVRQIPAHEAFHAAAAEQAVALPAVLAGIAGAVLGRVRDRRRASGSRMVLAWLVAGVGLLGLLDGMFPEHRRSLVRVLDAAHVHGISKALVVPLALALIVDARAASRAAAGAPGSSRSRCSRSSFVLHVERRFDDGAIVTGIAVVALLARRGDVPALGDPSAQAARRSCTRRCSPPALSATASSRSG